MIFRLEIYLINLLYRLVTEYLTYYCVHVIEGYYIEFSFTLEHLTTVAFSLVYCSWFDSAKDCGFLIMSTYSSKSTHTKLT